MNVIDSCSYVVVFVVCCLCLLFVFFQAEDGIRDLVRSRGLGDVYKRQGMNCATLPANLDMGIVCSLVRTLLCTRS